MGRTALIILIAFLVLGIVPLYLFAFELPLIPLHLLVGINFIAWFVAGLLYIVISKALMALDKATGSLGLPYQAGFLGPKLERFIEELSRYHRVSYGYRLEGEVSAFDLGANLQRIAKLAHEEVLAQSVELSLYDEASGQWSQAILIGAPHSDSSQSMLLEASQQSKTEGVLIHKNSKIIVEPVKFAGTLFGMLRVELIPDAEPSQSDLHVLKLLATQGALLLVDARFTEELLRLRQASEESVRAKTGFLANLSHELRGPLGIILNGTELALEGLCGPLLDAQKETLIMIKESGDHLLDLVNDVLDYAKVEAGKITINPVFISLKDLLEDLHGVIRSQAESKKQKIVLEPVDPTLGMRCDKRHARQILINLLTNAVKYTQDGGSITISANRTANGFVKISISDTGIGIPESERSKVFAAFERVDDEYALSQVGTGLGMPLTKKLVESNLGKIDFISEEGKGSTFWILMSAVEVDAHEIVGDVESGSLVVQGNGDTILIVDHDPTSRDMYSQYLNHQGFAVRIAKNPSEIMKFLKNETVELLVLENEMPGLSGEEMIGAIRGNPRAAQLPIVLISSKAFVFDIERFLKLGVDRCLSKPLALHELAITVRRLIDERRSLSEAKALPNS